MITQAESKWVAVTRWAPIQGIWTTADRTVHFSGPGATPLPGAHGLAICDERFRDGVIRVGIRFEASTNPMKGDAAGIVLGYHAESGSYLVAGLGAFDQAYSIWEFLPTAGWVNRRAVGLIENLRSGQDYQVEVALKGQRLALMVDSVPVIEHLLASPPLGNQLGLYAMSRAPVRFQDFAVQRKAPTAFVAMQFGEPYDTLYRSVIRPKAQALGFEVVRIDELHRPGIIFQDIQRKIEDAKVVIAEITAPNQNVFYEIGYAHALNKPTILLAQQGRELPFDIRSYRVIFYDDSIGGKPTVDRTLREHLQSILQEL
jgi:hypothetical protein